jgi:putative aminopeptidase FrvX
MNQASKKFLHKLLDTPSPTGYETKIQRVVKARMKDYSKHIETDLHGNLYVGLNTKAKRSIILAGHCDQIGFLVKHIDDKGFIYLDPLGGIDTTVLSGSLITIMGKKGDVAGVIGKEAIHLIPAEQRGRSKVTWDKLWVDIGAKSKKDAEKLVEVGNPAVYKPGVTELQNDYFSAPGLDDRVGLFVVMEALRLLSRAKLNIAVYAVSTVQEEVGLRGATTAAHKIQPELAIAVDVYHGSDYPGRSSAKIMPCILGKGPAISRGPNTNPVLLSKLEAVAKKKKIPFQPWASGRLLGNDARAMQVAGRAVATADLAIPNRYMHTQVEVCHYKDLELSAKLLAEFIKSIGPKTDFTPK